MLRRRDELRAKTRALTAEARTSAMVLAAMPFVTSGAIILITPGYFKPLFTDPARRLDHRRRAVHDHLRHVDHAHHAAQVDGVAARCRTISFWPAAPHFSCCSSRVNAALLLRAPGRERQIKMRLAAMKGVAEVKSSGPPSRFATLQKIGLALVESPLVGAKEQAKIVAQLGEAGIYGRDALRIFVALKAALGIGLTVLVWIALGASGMAPSGFIYRVIVDRSPLRSRVGGCPT